MTTTAPVHAPEITEAGARTRLRWVWILVLVPLAVVAGVVLWLLLAGGEGEPTVTFDGATATYSGPSTLPEGATQFTFENNSDIGAGFAVTQLGPERDPVRDSVASSGEASAWSSAIILRPGVADARFTTAAPNTTEVQSVYVEPPTVELLVANLTTDQHVLVAALDITTD